MRLPSIFRHRAYAVFWLRGLLSNIATMMQSVALGWSVYSIARQSYDEHQSMFLVGMIGLAQFLPMFVLSLLAGETADRYDRRKILLYCVLLQTSCAAAFTWLSLQPHLSLTGIFIIAGFFGVARAFTSPASASLLPALVPRDEFPKAVAWSSLSHQSAMVLGPWMGGVLCAVSPSYANAAACALYLMASVAVYFLAQMPLNAKPSHNGAARLTMIREGLAHLWDSKIVLGAISLDLFAALLGGVTALLPAYAKDILFTGPEGFGRLRSAFAVGAVCLTFCLTLRPIKRHTGKWMLGGVTIYGLATLCFALSRDARLSMLALAVAGAADAVSVFVRQNLVQILTPDPMRGRVSAVSGLFISASNELGEFESGVAARFLGIVGSAVLGGIGSVVVTCLWAKIFPTLRKTDRLTATEM
ncbi:MAG: MFS transporter [Alphaproteobacteria bacterium]|nr:MFS transporter [Alphaproteobacteria bacterium]